MMDIITICILITLIIFKERLLRFSNRFREKYFTAGPVLLPVSEVYENVSEIYYSHKVKDYLGKVQTIKFYVGCAYQPDFFYNDFKLLINYQNNIKKPEDASNLEVSASHELLAFEDAISKGGFPADNLIEALRVRYFKVMSTKKSLTHIEAMSKEHPNPENSIRFLFIPFDIDSSETEQLNIKNDFKIRNTKACLYFFEKVINHNVTCQVVYTKSEIVKEKVSDYIIFISNRNAVIWNYYSNSKELLVLRRKFPIDPNPLHGTLYGEIIKCYENPSERGKYLTSISRFREKLF